MKNDKREVRSHKEDAVLNRVLIWFSAAVVVELVMLLLNRYYINYTTSGTEIEFAYAMSKVLWPAALVCLAAAVLCAFWFISARKKESNTTIPLILALTFAVLFACFAITYWFRDIGVQLLCGAVPVAAVIALVYYLYQKEFFAVTVLSAVGILGLWFVRKVGAGHMPLVYAYMAAAAVLIVLAVLFFRALQKNGGILNRGEKQLHIFTHDTSYGMLYLTCGIVAAVLIAACILGTAVAYYLIFGLVAWLFVTAVYYTVKLM